MNKLSLTSLSLSLFALLSTSCAVEEPSGSPNCTADKCDALDSLVNLIRTDKVSVPVQKLVEQGVPAFEAVACTELARVITNDVEAHSQEELTTLASGLATTYGEHDLSTRVNAIRSNHLASTSDRAYLEADVDVDTDIGTGFSYSAGGFNSNVKLGFSAGLSFRFITAMEDTPSGILDKNLPDTLQDICDQRDFLIPQSLSDLSTMKEGDLVALHGEGWLGINLGLNVPILVGDPTAFATYSVVLNAGYSQRLEGDIDTQVIRLDGNKVVLDVGITNAKIKEASLRLSDDWGVQSFCGQGANVDCDYKVFGKNLSDIVDDAVEDMLDAQVNVFEATYQRTSEHYRMSVTRIVLDLGSAKSEEVEVAFTQAMVGDLRLLQALAYRGEPGVAVEFDLLRSGMSATSAFGVDVFGASLFKRNVIEANGTVSIQTPGGVNSIYFDTFHKSGGWGSSDRGYTRVGIGGIQFNTGSDLPPVGDANLIIQVMQSHDSLKADKLLDHLDGAIIGMAGLDGLEIIEERGNDLMQQVSDQCRAYVNDVCPSGSTIPCNKSAAARDCTALVFEQNPELVANIQAAASRDLDFVTQDLSSSAAALVREAANTRFAAQACYAAHRYGPTGSVVSDFRLDNEALAYITQPNMAASFEQSVRNFLGASEIDRADEDFAEERADVLADHYSKLDDITEIFEKYSSRYRAIGEVESASLARFGSPAVEIQLSGAEANDGLAKITISSLAGARATAAARLFDELREGADGFFGDLGPKAEFTIAYGLLGMVPIDSIDLRVDVDFTDDKEVYQDVCDMGFGFDQTAQGSAVSPIKAGAFSLDNLVGLTTTREESEPEE